MHDVLTRPPSREVLVRCYEVLLGVTRSGHLHAVELPPLLPEVEEDEGIQWRIRDWGGEDVVNAVVCPGVFATPGTDGDPILDQRMHLISAFALHGVELC
jgi:hypothetical protein